MIHAREDYNRIQDPALSDPSLLGEGCTPIGENEPVFLLRAQDENFVEMLEHYRYLLYLKSQRRGQEPPREMIRAVNGHIEYSDAWQHAHGTKTPDLPKQETARG